MRRRSSGNAKGEEEAEPGHMVVGTGVTMDFSAVDDRTLTVSVILGRYNILPSYHHMSYHS